MTVALSLIRINSAIRWVTINTAMPLSRNSRIFLNNLSVESKSSEAEDSSRINTFVFSRKKTLPIVIHALIGNDKLNTKA